jgi:SMI1 / KNR4 family (SUKH-1)
MASLPADLLARIAERANDPYRRSYMSGAEAHAKPTPFNEIMARLDETLGPDTPNPMRLGLEFMKKNGIAVPTMNVIDNGGDGMRAFAGPAGPQPLSTPPSQEQLAAAERKIGHAFPEELRQLYAIADGGFGPGLGTGLFPLAQSVDQYAYQQSICDWPNQLLPLAQGEIRLLSIDVERGQIVSWNEYWEDDGLSKEEAFTTEYPSLAAFMEAWLASPTYEEEQVVPRPPA